jgi:hypothetical protein
LKGNVIGKSFRGGVDRKIMEFAESKEKIGCRGVCNGGHVVNGHSEENRALVNEIYCPSILNRLPGQRGNMNHFLVALNTS